MRAILPVVEGEGDMQAVPTLVRRILHEQLNVFDVQVLQAHKRGDLPKVRQQFSRWYETALIEGAPILWVMDFDCSDCTDHEAERHALLAQAKAISPLARIEIVFMVKEFESIFLYDIDVLRSGFPELLNEATLPNYPEAIRDAKGCISRSLPKGRAYKETVDQARLCHHLSLEAARQFSPSFARFASAVEALIESDDINSQQEQSNA